jgi:hypothetical protein
MLYDNVHSLRDVLHHFLLANPELFYGRETCAAESPRVALQGADIPFRQRLETWLDTTTTLTDRTHRATLLQLADTYAALQQLPDTAPMHSNGVAFSPRQ